MIQRTPATPDGTMPAESLEGVGYVRVSGASQTSGDGFPRQDEAIARLFERMGVQYAACYVEYGVTGDSNLDGREALGALAVALENGCPKTIGIEHPDRMARGMMAGLTILDDMRRLQARVYCACDGREWTIDKHDPEAVMFWGIRQLYAQYDKMRLIAKLRAAKLRKKARGERAEGGFPFGAKPGEQAAAARFWELAERTTSPTELCRRLNAAGVRTRTGVPWTRQMVQKMLRRGKPKEIPCQA